MHYNSTTFSNFPKLWGYISKTKALSTKRGITWNKFYVSHKRIYVQYPCSYTLGIGFWHKVIIKHSNCLDYART